MWNVMLYTQSQSPSTGRNRQEDQEFKVISGCFTDFEASQCSMRLGVKNVESVKRKGKLC